MKHAFVGIAVILTITFSSLAAAKTDVVIFDNGDRLTGEVKSLERGKLRFKTDATGTISIEWDDVASVTSNQNIQVETDGGDRYMGRLKAESEAGHIVLETFSGPVTLDSDHIVFMTPIETKGFDRFDGDITAGFNYNKGSQVKQTQFGLDLEARTEIRVVGLDISSITSDTAEDDSSQRQTLSLNFTHLWPRRWFTGASIGAERNDELGLDLRSTIGVNGGRYMRQTNTSILSWVAGLQYSKENVSSNDEDKNTLEAVATLAWDWFRYDTPELDFSTKLEVIPNLTDFGRVRAEFDVGMKWEMIDDLFWELELYDSYDSDPVVDGAEKNDYGIITSLGWKF
jgi:hypothetical protein